MNKRNYDKESVELNEKKYNYNFDSIVREYMFRTWSKYLTDGAALEVGCYHGDSTVILKSKFNDLTVVEPSMECIKIAKQKVGNDVVFIHDVAENINSEKKFDHIFLVNTLEHWDDPAKLLNSIKKMLAKKGRLYVLVPNADAPSRVIAAFMGVVDFSTAVTPAEYIHGHRRTYSFDILNKDIVSSGFSIIDRGGIIYKGLANYQMDLALENKIINSSYIEACYQYGLMYAHQTASLFVVAECK